MARFWDPESVVTSMAGFQVTFNGRFWVTAEDLCQSLCQVGLFTFTPSDATGQMLASVDQWKLHVFACYRRKAVSLGDDDFDQHH